MAKRPTLKVSKTDAAKRQLETAIRLWFFGGDPISVHTLTAAAHQVLHDLGKNKGSPTILRGLAVIRPDKVKQVEKLVCNYENFFKHADRDPGALLDFNPEATEIYLLDAVVTYEGLTHEAVPVLSVFKIWVFLNHPEYMNESERGRVTQWLSEAGSDFAQVPKAEFFRRWLPQLLELGIT